MRLRSLLFVPGDRPERFAKGAESGADALILDLEDSVALERKEDARAAVRAFLVPPRIGKGDQGAKQHGGGGPAMKGSLAVAPLHHSAAPNGPPPRSGEERSRPLILVRVNPLDSGMIDADLAALAASPPDAIMLPKAEGAASVRALVAKFALSILPIATETPAAIFTLGSYAEVSGHLIGLTWGAEDLPAAIGASTSREADGSYTPPYQLARSLTLFAANAAGVPAIETVYPDFRDLVGLAAYAERARRDGFTGMMAIHPAQVPVINAAFTPSSEELEHARAVVGAFSANPGSGVLQLDGKMIDAPHLKVARRTLGL